MSKESGKPPLKESKVPAGRFARLSRFGALATTVAGGMVAEGARQLAQGKRPKLSQMVLTPANALRVADQLSRLRGAAMKLGQLLSMDAGDFLPKELSDILAKLRSEGKSMPRKQLLGLLAKQWGDDWQSRLQSFDMEPVAAASIGQVHRAVSLEGEVLAVKIQYPGVAQSIDSDLDNVASLLRMTGLIPKHLDISSILSEAKKQLHEEADYLREAEYIRRYTRALGDSPDFELPEVYEPLTTATVLAMKFVHGIPIETVSDLGQATADKVGQLLFGLMFREIFDFKLMQTDPNFANFLYNPETDRLVLLDFGATRELPKEIVFQYEKLVRVALQTDELVRDVPHGTLDKIATDIGYYDDKVKSQHRQTVRELMWLATEPLRQGVYSFGQTGLSVAIRGKGFELAENRDFWHTPPMDCVFLHRKVGGLFLLASRLQATIDLRRALATVKSPSILELL